MNILITPDTPFSEIIDQFKVEYPFLSLAFYSKPLWPQHVSREDDRLPDSTTLASVAPHLTEPIIISTDRATQVVDLEQMFQERCGIGIQVLRLLKNKYRQVILNSDWSLHRVNIEAEGDAKFFG